MIGRQGIDGESLAEDSNDSSQVGVVWAEDDGVVGLDEVAKVAVNVGRLVNVFRNGEPRKPSSQPNECYLIVNDPSKYFIVAGVINSQEKYQNCIRKSELAYRLKSYFNLQVKS